MTKQRAIMLLALPLLLLPAVLMAQVVTGTVTSEGQPLSGANVIVKGTAPSVVKGTATGTSTDENGKYTLKLPPGTYDIVFSSVGHETKTLPVSLRENEEKVLDVELKTQELKVPEVVVVVGARATQRTVTDSPLPVDIFSSQEISHTGQNTFDKILQYRVPSFNTAQTPVNDATALLDPWEIRNMGVSRTLILINGKRKNISALVYTQTSPSRGETAVDISAIPVDAIQRVEILRDGASAQYGSDAIAGVVNVVLKDNTEGGAATFNSGVTDAGDGARVGVALNNGTSIFENKGFFNYTLDLSRVNEARRSGIVDPDGDFADFGDPARGYNLNYIKNFLAYDKYAGNRNSSPTTSAAKFLVNSGVAVSENTDFYANGLYTYKKVNSYANYRTPYWRTLSDYPYLKDFFAGGDSAAYKGYVPTFDGDLVDYNATIGFKSRRSGWNYDASFTLGLNSQDYAVLNSHNRSNLKDSTGIDLYRENSPINFKPGGSKFSHQVWNLDVAKALTDELSIGIGSEFRNETYEIVPGDKASWDGVGADSYAGNRPENSGIFNRYNFGGYLDAGYDVTKYFLLSGTIRNEWYSDFGNAFVYKVSSRYKTLGDKLTLRGSYSTGFRAPTLHQIYTQRVQYSFVPGKGIQSIGLVNNVSPQTRLLGVNPLKAEESKNLTLGLGARFTDDINLTFDYYNIALSNRIVISNRVTTDTVTNSQVEFFTNSIETRTQGLDAVVDCRNINIGGLLGFSLAANINIQNERTSDIPKVKGTNVIGPTQEALFFTSRPRQKIVLTTTYQIDKWNLNLNETYFGTTEFRQDGLDPNLKTVFNPKVVSDFAVSYDLFNNINLSANVNNIFNVVPEWKYEALNAAGQAILSDPAQVKVQTNLITFNGRYAITTYDGVHFSQLGRFYNASMTYKF